MTVENIHWLGHASFRIVDGENQIYIDPWKLAKNSPKADYIFVTHSHYDHLSKDDIKKISTKTTQIFAAKDVADQLKKNVTFLAPNKTITTGQLVIKTVPAYNINKQFHPKNKNWLGFIIKLSNDVTIYHSGDTDYIPEMNSLNVDIALLPVSGTYVMTAKEAIEAANSFKPKIVIPMHINDIVGTMEDANVFKKGFLGETIIKQIEK